MANMNFGVNILPKTNNTYSLGNSDYKWNIFANALNGVSLSNIITDVQINGTSILSNNIANISTATSSTLGVVKIDSFYGTNTNSEGRIYLSKATDTEIKAGTQQYKPIVPYSQHEAVFYGLAKAAGDSTQASSSNAVGTYTANAKSAIQSMLGIPVTDVQINGTSILNNKVANIPIATSNIFGVVKGGFGTTIDANGYFNVNITHDPWYGDYDKTASADSLINELTFLREITRDIYGDYDLPNPTTIENYKIGSDGDLVADSNCNTYVYEIPANDYPVFHLWPDGDNIRFQFAEYSSTPSAASAIVALNRMNYLCIQKYYNVTHVAFSCEKGLIEGEYLYFYAMKGTGVAFNNHASTTDYGVVKVGNGLTVNSSSGALQVNTMTGATSSVAGSAGLVPAPTTSDTTKFLAGDGTWKDGGMPMVILSYGNSTWNDFINAYNNRVIVYCRASSNSNPASGSQTRMAFMAYVNDASSPTNVEFQYYRSMNAHSSTAMGDEVYIYKLTNANGGTWSVTTRKASIKEIAVASGSKLDVSWSSDKVTLSNTMTADDMPMSSSDATTTKSAIDTLNSQLNTKVDEDQGVANAGKYMKVGNDGTLVPDNVDAFPIVTSSDNNKVLEVVEGEWTVGNKKIDKEYTREFSYAWSEKTWSELTSFSGNNIWSDGDNIYYSSDYDQYVFDKSTSTWSAKTWTGLTGFSGNCIWSDGNNIYYSATSSQYVLDKSTSTWSSKTWSGLIVFDGYRVWSDGNNIYYSNGPEQYILNKSNSAWSKKTWIEYIPYDGSRIWTDGDNIYYSENSVQYILNKSNSTWSTKTWTGLTNFSGLDIWSDGDDIYYSNSTSQYILDKTTSIWSVKAWTGLTSFRGYYIWSDGDNIYYSTGSTQYVTGKDTSPKILLGTNGEFNPAPANMSGASTSSAGTSGLVPAPAIGDQDKYLKGDGTWATTSSVLTLTASSSSWSNTTPPTQTITATGVTASNNIVVGIAKTATSAQYTAAAKAQLLCTAQAANSITLTCYGTKPTVNIPISVMIVG